MVRFFFDDMEGESSRKKSFSTLDVRARRFIVRSPNIAAMSSSNRRAQNTAGPSLDAGTVRQYWAHFQEMERLREEQSAC